MKLWHEIPVNYEKEHRLQPVPHFIFDNDTDSDSGTSSEEDDDDDNDENSKYIYSALKTSNTRERKSFLDNVADLSGKI